LNTVAGTGGPISFGIQNLVGGYGVVATNGSTGCMNAMNGSAGISGGTAPLVTIANAYTNNNNPQVWLPIRSIKTLPRPMHLCPLSPPATGTGLTYAWRNTNNQVVGNGSTLVVSNAGTYTVTVTNSGACSGTATKTIALGGCKMQWQQGTGLQWHGNSQCVTTAQAQAC
jgi:hypothetical protein